MILKAISQNNTVIGIGEMNTDVTTYVQRHVGVTRAQGAGRGAGGMRRTDGATQATGSPHTHDSRASRSSPAPN